MKKRFISIAICLALVITAAGPSYAVTSLSNFGEIYTYQDQFTDISPSAWYFDGVRGVYQRGIMVGKSTDTFDPLGTLTLAETIKIAACLHKGYYTGTMDFASGSPWETPYIAYAIEKGIIPGNYRTYSTAATRSDFAMIIAGAIPDEAVTPINRIADGAIPDVFESYSYGQAVYKLYRAGVLTGADSEGTYYPGRTLKRAEAAVIIMRILNADSRQKLSLKQPLTAEQIYKLASPAVFFIEVYDNKGIEIKTGSGFFISKTGLAVTNYHVLVGASSARIIMDNGKILDVEGIYDYDRKDDLAILQIKGSDFPYLEFADSSKIQTGATVYTLGSPLGLYASFSRGIVSQSQRGVENAEYIQIDAPISSGSSGGALLDTSGRVVGITCATAVDGQNINLAVPVNFLEKLKRETHVPLNEILTKAAYYRGSAPVPDFGVYFNVSEYAATSAFGGVSHSYLMSDLQDDVSVMIDEYVHLLEQNLFYYYGVFTINNVNYQMYYHIRDVISVMFGFEEVRGAECFTVNVS